MSSYMYKSIYQSTQQSPWQQYQQAPTPRPPSHSKPPTEATWILQSHNRHAEPTTIRKPYTNSIVPFHCVCTSITLFWPSHPARSSLRLTIRNWTLWRFCLQYGNIEVQVPGSLGNAILWHSRAIWGNLLSILCRLLYLTYQNLDTGWHN
jgi:hypothetical protein